MGRSVGQTQFKNEFALLKDATVNSGSYCQSHILTCLCGSSSVCLPEECPYSQVGPFIQQPWMTKSWQMSSSEGGWQMFSESRERLSSLTISLQNERFRGDSS